MDRGNSRLSQRKPHETWLRRCVQASTEPVSRELRLTAARSSAFSRGPAKASSIDPKIAERVALIGSSALFRGISKQGLLKIASCARSRSLERDEFLFMQGQTIDSLIMICRGRVKLTQLSSEGIEVILWMAGEGDLVCVPDDSSSRRHSCSARVKEHCSVLVWERDKLRALMAQYPIIENNITLICSRRIRELEERFHEVATEKLTQRVAFTLLRLANQIGKPIDGGTEVSVTREELLQFTGSSVFTISRIISQWAGEGLLLARRESLVLFETQLLAWLRKDDDGSEITSVTSSGSKAKIQ